ncbi:hypothetical protein BRC93_02760 [Halobacteriales archaeon QS_5_70_15]|nr:MAG: hypothetical protein BRC93_02760 [Halobacteriales archaeon QS_5_70_15]
MATQTERTGDMSLGLSLLFGALGVVGALGMYLFAVSGDQVSSGWAFALAMVAAAVLVAVVHVYD